VKNKTTYGEMEDIMRSEIEIRKRLGELNEKQLEFTWADPERAIHAKTTLRAQMKGLLFALGEEKGFSIVSDEIV
jgi:hypothetical protein